MGLLKSLRKNKVKRNLLKKKKILDDKKQSSSFDDQQIVRIASASSTAPLSPESHSSPESFGSMGLEEPADLQMIFSINSEFEEDLPPSSAPTDDALPATAAPATSNSKSRSKPVVQFSKKNITIEHESSGLSQTLSTADLDDQSSQDSFDDTTCTYDASTVATFRTNCSDNSMQYLWKYLTCARSLSTFDLLREDEFTIDTAFTYDTDQTNRYD